MPKRSWKKTLINNLTSRSRNSSQEHLEEHRHQTSHSEDSLLTVTEHNQVSARPTRAAKVRCLQNLTEITRAERSYDLDVSRERAAQRVANENEEQRKHRLEEQRRRDGRRHGTTTGRHADSAVPKVKLSTDTITTCAKEEFLPSLSNKEIGLPKQYANQKVTRLVCVKCKAEVEPREAEMLLRGREKAMVAKVYHFLEREYRELKEKCGDVDLTHLLDFRRRTAEATGVSERTVERILEEENDWNITQSEPPAKRPRVDQEDHEINSNEADSDAETLVMKIEVADEQINMNYAETEPDMFTEKIGDPNRGIPKTHNIDVPIGTGSNTVQAAIKKEPDEVTLHESDNICVSSGAGSDTVEVTIKKEPEEVLLHEQYAEVEPYVPMVKIENPVEEVLITDNICVSSGAGSDTVEVTIKKEPEEVLLHDPVTHGVADTTEERVETDPKVDKNDESTKSLTDQTRYIRSGKKKTNAQRCKDYRERKRKEKFDVQIKPQITNAQKCKQYRERKNKIKLLQETNNTESARVNNKRNERQQRYREKNREKLKQLEAERRKRIQYLRSMARPSTSSNINRIGLNNEEIIDANSQSSSGLEGAQTSPIQRNKRTKENNSLQKKRERQQRYREQNREKLKQREAERRQRLQHSELITESCTSSNIEFTEINNAITNELSTNSRSEADLEEMQRLFVEISQ